MDAITVPIAMLVLFQLKHFLADYMLQPKWMLTAKGQLFRIGGYAHAGTHAVGSLPALSLAGLAAPQLFTLVAAEFVVHYAIDYGKAGLSCRSHAGPDKPQFWALHGADQLLHHLTYAALILAAT